MTKISIPLYEINAPKKHGGNRLWTRSRNPATSVHVQGKVVKITRKCTLINKISNSFRKWGSPNGTVV